MSEEEYNGPPHEPERPGSRLLVGTMATVLLGYVAVNQVGAIANIGIEEWVEEYVIPSAEWAYEYAQEHPEVWVQIFVAVVFSGFVIKRVSKRVFKGESKKAKIGRSVFEFIIRQIKGF